MDKDVIQWSDFSRWFTKALMFLLENKHLYQSIDIYKFACQYDKQWDKFDWKISKKWHVNFDTLRCEAKVALPNTISVVCANGFCGNSMQPHNLGIVKVERLGDSYGSGSKGLPSTINQGYFQYFSAGNNTEVVQVFSL